MCPSVALKTTSNFLLLLTLQVQHWPPAAIIPQHRDFSSVSLLGKHEYPCVWVGVCVCVSPQFRHQHYILPYMLDINIQYRVESVETSSVTARAACLRLRANEQRGSGWLTASDPSPRRKTSSVLVRKDEGHLNSSASCSSVQQLTLARALVHVCACKKYIYIISSVRVRWRCSSCDVSPLAAEEWEKVPI